MIEASAAMWRRSIILCIGLLGWAALSSGCSGGAHTLRYAPAAGQIGALEADILRQSPTGLLAVKIRGTASVLEARGDTRRVSFEVESAEVTENGRLVVETGHLGALTRMAGVELRFILDGEGRLLGQPTVHGARDDADAEVHAAVLDDLIQAGGAFAGHGVDVGESWSHPWGLHGIAAADIDGELRSTLVSHDGETAEVALLGTLEIARQDLDNGWTISGEGSAHGHSRVSLPAGTTEESFISIRARTSGRSPDGIESEFVVVAELWVRHPESASTPPPQSLLACQGRLRDLATPTLSLSSEAEDSSFARLARARVTSDQGAPIDAAAPVVRLERDRDFVDGVATDDVRLWAHDDDAARGIVYLDVAPDVTAARVAEVAQVLGSPRLLVGGAEDSIAVGPLVGQVEALAGSCAAAATAAHLAADDDLLRPAFTFVHGVRAAVGSCGCAVGDLDGLLELVGETARQLSGSLRYLPIDADALAAAPEGTLAESIPGLLVFPSAPVAPPADETPTPAEESK